MTADAIPTVADLTKSDSENIRLQALREIFDRLLGRPAVSLDTTVTKMDLSEAIGEAYRRALVRANSHVVPSEPVVEGKANGNAPP
jgi:hypothetical protein